MDAKKVWIKVLEEIKPEIGMVNFRGYFSHTEATNIDNQKITISVPTAFFQDTIKEKFLNICLSGIEKVTGQKLNLEFKIDPSKLSKNKVQVEDDSFFDISSQPIQTYLNSKYTMENFVVGLSNNVAFAAAGAVAANPGLSYNPLLIYGGTGVGKTHLMIAIGNSLLKKNPNLKTIYCSSEKFMNDYVEALQNHRMGSFRNKYRAADVILVDDVQFFSGREGTQEEFFHTFNELQGRNCQIILTSDRTPQEIAKLEDRLKSRFAGGLMVDIQPPDFDTRVAILRAKCIEHMVSLPEEVLQTIASSFEGSIRELEGKLVQILQGLKAQNLPANIENIRSYLDFIPKQSLKVDFKKVISTICGYFDLSQKDLTGPKRQKELVLPRHFTMFLLCEELNMTVEKVGQILGGRDHTTVMHGRDRIKNLVNIDREAQKTLIEIKQKLIQ